MRIFIFLTYFPVVMRNYYYDLGDLAISKAAQTQSVLIARSSEPPQLTSIEDTADIFEIALRRIGDDASAFKEDSQNINDVVFRTHSVDSILTTVISSIEEGNVAFAKEIVSLQKKHLYLENVGYIDPHGAFLESPTEGHIALRDNTLKNGILLNETLRQKARDNKLLGKQNPDNVFQRGTLSPVESVYAIYANLVVGDIDHAKKVIKDMKRIYFNEKTGMFYGQGYKDRLSTTLNVARAMDLAGDSGGKEIFESLSNKILRNYGEQLMGGREFYLLPAAALVFALDHFKMKNEANTIRQFIELNLPEPSYNYRNPRHAFESGRSGENNPLLCRLGLALTGLENDKLNRFYTCDDLV